MPGCCIARLTANKVEQEATALSTSIRRQTSLPKAWQVATIENFRIELAKYDAERKPRSRNSTGAGDQLCFSTESEFLVKDPSELHATAKAVAGDCNGLPKLHEAGLRRWLCRLRILFWSAILLTAKLFNLICSLGLQ